MQNQIEQGTTRCYSIAFKQKVISETKEGKYTQHGSSEKIGVEKIGGRLTEDWGQT